MSGLITPSWKLGFARNADESEAPGLWKGLAGAWYPSLGPTGLTLVDVSGYDSHGTLQNMDPATGWVTAEKGWAVDFLQANDNHIDFGVFTACDSGAFTVSCLAYIIGGEGNSGLFSNNTGGNQTGPFLCQGSAVYPNAAFLSGDQTIAFSVSTNDWHLVSLVRHPGTVGIEGFVDDKSVGTAAGRSGIITGQKLYLAWRERSDRHTSCRVAAFLIHDRALALPEIQQLYVDPDAMLRLRQEMFPAAVAAGNPWYYYAQQEAAA